MRPAGELFRIEDVGRLVDEVAGEQHAGRKPVRRPHRLFGRGRILNREDELRRRVRLLVAAVLLLGLVAVELVGAQPCPESHLGNGVRARLETGRIDEHRGGAAGGLAGEETAEHPPIVLRPVLLPADADDDQTVELQVVRSRDGHGGLRLALEALQLGDPGDEAHRLAAEFLRDAFGHLAVVAGEHDRVAPLRTSERQKIDLDGVGHEALRQGRKTVARGSHTAICARRQTSFAVKAPQSNASEAGCAHLCLAPIAGAG